MAIYGVCIFVANFLLAIRFNTHTWCSTFTLLAGVIAYFVFYGLLSQIFKNQINHLFEANMSMNKKLLQRLYGELKTYEQSGKLPDPLQEKVDNNETETAKDEARLASQPTV